MTASPPSYVHPALFLYSICVWKKKPFKLTAIIALLQSLVWLTAKKYRLPVIRRVVDQSEQKPG